MIRRVGASLPLAVVLLQVTAVAVLLPDIRLALGSSTSGGQWALNAYLLALAALLPACVTLRSRWLTAAGVVVWAAGAVACATADSTAALVAGQAAQGAGAAAVLAAAIGPEGSIAGAVLPGLALAFGPLVGGVFAEENWWHVFFWAGVPLAAVAGLGALLTPRSEPTEALPPIRLLALAGGLAAVTIAEVQSEVWATGWWALLLIAGVALLGRAVPDLRPSTLAWAALAGCLAALVFLVPEYLQLARNLSGLRSGTLLLTVTVPAVTVLGRVDPARGPHPRAAARRGGSGLRRGRPGGARDDRRAHALRRGDPGTRPGRDRAGARRRRRGQPAAPELAGGLARGGLRGRDARPGDRRRRLPVRPVRQARGGRLLRGGARGRASAGARWC